MKKGTRIKYKGQKYNEDGDRPVNFDDVPKIGLKEEYEKAFDDHEIHFMHITDERMYGVDKLIFENNKFTLVEPNPVTFYYSLAFDSIYQVKQSRENLKNILIDEKRKKEKSQAFSFVFRVSSVSIIFSFLALEAFLNQLLPDCECFDCDGKKINKNKAQKFTPFFDKLYKIIPSITKKDFKKSHPKETNDIENLKKMRDNLIHLKEIKNGFTSYNEIYQKILEADLESIVFSVKQFINYYSPNLIENYNMKTMIK